MAENIIAFGAGFVGVLLGWAMGYFMHPKEKEGRGFRRMPDMTETAMRFKKAAEGWQDAAKRWHAVADQYKELYEKR